MDPKKLVSPEYPPEIVSVPPGAAEEVQEPLPFDNKVAVHSDVDPVVNVTVPVGVGAPVTPVVTVVEYVTEEPSGAAFGVALTEVCVVAGFTTRLVVPLDPVKLVLPEYAPEIVSVPPGAAEELHEPLPPDNVAVHNEVDPAVNVTVPVGVNPVTPVVTLVE